MMVKQSLISVIVPIHNESSNIAWHHEKLTKHLLAIPCDYELIYVDDGSRDDSLKMIKAIAHEDAKVRYLSFSRNFGKEAATSAGLEICHGDAALMIDADGQHPIEIIDEFLAKWHAGAQVIVGIRLSNTKEGFVKRYGSKFFYRAINIMSDGETIPRSTDFRLVDRVVIDEFNNLTEHNRITRGLIDWLGFKRDAVEFRAAARQSGEAAYGFKKLAGLAMHAFVSQSTKPLRFTGFLGALVTLLSAIAGVFIVFEKYLFDDWLKLAISGTALLALFVSFLVGLVLMSNWLLALYIESIHNETQNRPLYIVAESNVKKD